VTRAERLFPLAERYIQLVLERRHMALRMNKRDVSKLDIDIDEALRDYESAEARETVAQMDSDLPPRSPARPRPGARRYGPSHPWNSRAVPPKR